MKISIVTPTYNSEKTVADTLQSVCGQTHKDLEHIIIDGASCDTTTKIAEGFKVERIISEPDRGIYDAMNKGIALARGEIVGILNSDDFYKDETVLSKIADVFKDESIDVVYGDILIVDPNNTDKVWRYWKSGKSAFHKMRRGWIPPHPAFFVRRHVYEKYGNFRLDFPISADYEFMLRLLYKERIKAAYIPEVITVMRGGGNSTKNLRQYIKGWKELRQAWKVNDLEVPLAFSLFRPLLKLKQYIMRP
jgi:glycosyltransferase